MLIECILLRAGGTKAEVGGVTYHFAPLPTGEHVADVPDRDHAIRFLELPEGYRAFNRINEAPGISPGVAGAAEESGAGATVPGGASTQSLDTMTREQLVALYEEREGRKPHHRLGDDKLREELAVLLAGD